MPASPGSRARRSRIALAAVAGVLAVVVLVGVAERASEGRQAILRWQPTFEALVAGEDVYARPAGAVPADAEGEGYPTLPLSALCMHTLLLAGPVAGCVLFALVKLACAGLLLGGSVRLARAAGWPFPPLAEWLLLLLTLRVILSDVSHGNTNLLVGAAVIAVALCWSARRDGLAGGAIALGATLKVTPLLLAALPVVRRSGRGLAGLAVGLALFVVVLPGLWLGFGHTLGLSASWADQMLAPYLSGAPPGPMQTQQINQSLLGTLARLCTDSLAIEARGDVWPNDVSVALVHLDPQTFRWLHRGAVVAVLAVYVAALVRRPDRRLALGHVALGALAMLLASERTWKHHHVTLALPLAWCLGVACGPARRRDRVVCGLALAASLAGHGLSGSGVLGAAGSDLAEAFGAFTFADLALFGAVALSLWGAPAAQTPAPDPAGSGLPPAHSHGLGSAP